MTVTTTAIVGNAMMSKSFSLTAQMDRWDGNVMVDDLGSNPLGILMPGVTIDHVCVQSSGGNIGWRIIDTVTLRTKRTGWGVLTDYSCYESCAISPYTIQKTDTLQVYPLTVDSTSEQSATLAWVTSDSGTELYTATDIPDNVATAVSSAVNNQGIGDSIFGQRLRALSVQVETGATLKEVQVVDNTGGTIFKAYGTVRGVTAGSRSNYYNIDLQKLQIPISKGFILKVVTVSA